ncbi:MAG: cell division protein ZapA [Candidatus Rokubacteria bacterium]|nr:cell division protein ZapA [Candidatus Rokubacteria bacterium]
MTKTNRVEFELLGQKYAIRSDATPEYVRQLVAHVEKTVKQIQAEGGPKDPQKLAVLAAFYIADELFQTRDAGRQKDGAAAERVGALLELLEKTARPS